MTSSDSGRRRGPGQLESEILAVLWAADHPLTPAEVRSITDESLAYNTVHTILTRLCEKGQLVHIEYDERPAYTPVRSAADEFADRMRAVLNAGQDRHEILARFVSALDESDEAALRGLLRRRRKTR